ncbi:hypothetical protein MRB53_012574 [Persea americana]|uniref:Uncharacterized protein n=1 Tax=Persea americana TaxID=3435 RepID=A0ACC2LXU3_PERAE|nr:hypothetical protein MRB53_012574 [Persea americana]
MESLRFFCCFSSFQLDEDSEKKPGEFRGRRGYDTMVKPAGSLRREVQKESGWEGASFCTGRQIQDARRMIDKMPEGDLVTWNAIISRAVHGYTVRTGFELLVNVSTALVVMYAKCGLIEIQVKR